MDVEELDRMLGRGLPRGYSLLVAGPSGSGKTILASAFLVEGVRQGETGVPAVVEVRASRHSDEVREFMIDGEGIHIGAPLREYEGLPGGSPSRHGAKR